MSMGNNDVLQGTLDLLILKTLARGPMHGFGIAVHIQQVSDQVLRVEEGSLYPALHRIEQGGWISSEWVPLTTTAGRSTTDLPPWGASSCLGRKRGGTA
jgi:DNA-binding PadR family transcriptional regulator